MKTFFSSLTSTFNSFSNLFESSCFIKTDEKLTFWRITFRMSYWTSIKRFNWVWILIKKFFNFDLSDNSLWICYARMFANRVRNLNASCEFSIIIFFEEILWTRISKRLILLLYYTDINLHYKNEQIIQKMRINKFSFSVGRSKCIDAPSF